MADPELAAPPNDAVTEALFAEARAHLEPGETLRWAERPSPKRAQRRAWPLLLFGAVFALVAITALGWIGLIPAAFGALLAYQPYRMQRRAKRTLYLLTDRRAIVVRRRRGRETVTHSYGPDDVQDIKTRDLGDNTGDVVFRRELFVRRRSQRYVEEGGDPFRNQLRHRNIGFFGIRDVRGVAAALRELRHKARPA